VSLEVFEDRYHTSAAVFTVTGEVNFGSSGAHESGRALVLTFVAAAPARYQARSSDPANAAAVLTAATNATSLASAGELVDHLGISNW
jgi:hypothetical protein